jgi:hypothetical protein
VTSGSQILILSSESGCVSWPQCTKLGVLTYDGSHRLITAVGSRISVDFSDSTKLPIMRTDFRNSKKCVQHSTTEDRNQVISSDNADDVSMNCSTENSPSYEIRRHMALCS